MKWGTGAVSVCALLIATANANGTVRFRRFTIGARGRKENFTTKSPACAPLACLLTSRQGGYGVAGAGTKKEDAPSLG